MRSPASASSGVTAAHDSAGLREAVQEQHRPPVLGAVDPHVEGQIADIDPQQLSRHGRDASPALPSVPVSSSQTSPERDFVRAHLDDLHADLDAWLRIPSISADPAHADDVADSAAWLAEALRRVGFPTVEIWPTAGAPAVYAEWPQRRPRRTRRARLRPPRRAAGRPAGAVGAPAVRAHGRRRPGRPGAARPRRDRRQGQRRHAPARHARPPRRDRPRHPRRDRQAAHRGRGGVRVAAPRRAAARSGTDRLACDVVVVSDTGMAAPDLPSAVVVDARADRCGDHPARAGGRPALRVVRRRRPQPAARHGRPAGEPARRARPGHAARLLRQGPPARRPGARADGAGCRSTRRRGWPGRPRSAAPRRGRVQHPGAGRRPAHRGGQRHVGRLQGPRPQDDRPGRGARQGQLPAGGRPATRGHRRQVRAWVDQRLPEGITADVQTGPAASRPAPATSTRRPWPPCGGRSPRPGTAIPTTCSHLREGGSGPEADLVDALGAPLLFLGAGLPTDRIHSPNERVLLPMLHRGAEAAAHLWRELATLARDR